MSCKPIQTGSPLSTALAPAVGINALPKTSAPERPQTVYLCDGPDEIPTSPKPTPLTAFAAPSLSAMPVTSLDPSLQKSAALFAPVTALAPPPLPPPPESPLAKLLYDLTTQLKDFELTTTIKIPMEDLNPNATVKAITHAVIKDQGALVVLDVQFKPAVGPVPVVKILDQVPIIAPFFIVRLLKVEMDPTTRRLKAKVQYLFFPVTKEVHEEYLKKAQLPPPLIKGPGYDLTKGLPVYSWQMLDLFLKMLEQKGSQLAKNVGVEGVKPLLEQSEILMEGNFSNKMVSLSGYDLHFAPLAPNEKHRIRVTGSLYQPRVTVNGLKAAELKGPQGRMRLSNAQDQLSPLQLNIKIDPLGKKPVRFEIPEYQSKQVIIETLPTAPNAIPIRIDMQEGIEMKGLAFQYETDGPHLDIERLTIKRLAFEGLGVKLGTMSGDKAVLEDVHMKVKNGKPEFVSKISASATGELTFTKNGQQLGAMKFKSLQGVGSLNIGPDSKDDFRVEVGGSLTAEIPELKLLAQSEKIKASVATRVENATVGGVGRLTVWPDLGRAELAGTQTGKTLTVKGTGGMVTFHQDPSQVAAWPELKKELGDIDAAKVVTDFFVKPSQIEFAIEKMDLGLVVKNGGSPTLEIGEADIREINIKGDVWGKLFARFPGGIYYPLIIPQEAMMKEAVLKVGRLFDQKAKGQKRSVLFNRIELQGEESKATFSPKDQKRCGFDRQHIHAALGLFQFTEDREFKIEKVDTHFHVYLKNHIGGGCLKIE